MFQVPSLISKIITMSDGGLRLYVDTQELTDEDKAKVFSLHRKLGYFVMKESEIVQADVPTYVPTDKKTPSQRLRAVLYRVWEDKKEGEFEEFYKNKLEQIINHFKEKINV